eukprot:CAMPEP_0119497382 /NCGR_PEP_ID=MMETSP1344-20130328/20441_1 /TAXON_ID=236787 /ORGANISM="Florenciella parvula, Strain CCMP2471" /LENGTH=365 /DNA_ID=CAMNT_0007533165 /DNA_START=266 /DNA_END=1364 /DNA_ORIENTATION=-
MTFFSHFAPLLSRPWAGGCVVLSVASEVWLCTGEKETSKGLQALRGTPPRGMGVGVRVAWGFVGCLAGWTHSSVTWGTRWPPPTTDTQVLNTPPPPSQEAPAIWVSPFAMPVIERQAGPTTTLVGVTTTQGPWASHELNARATAPQAAARATRKSSGLRELSASSGQQLARPTNQLRPSSVAQLRIRLCRPLWSCAAVTDSATPSGPATLSPPPLLLFNELMALGWLRDAARLSGGRATRKPFLALRELSASSGEQLAEPNPAGPLPACVSCLPPQAARSTDQLRGTSVAQLYNRLRRRLLRSCAAVTDSADPSGPAPLSPNRPDLRRWNRCRTVRFLSSSTHLAPRAQEAAQFGWEGFSWVTPP